MDGSGRTVGVIAIDDAMAVLNYQHEEDILRLAGVGESSRSESALKTKWQRFPWLAVNLVAAILTSLLISQFEATIGKIIVFAVLMLIIVPIGDNVGTQCLTVTVRSLAITDLRDAIVYLVI